MCYKHLLHHPHSRWFFVSHASIFRNTKNSVVLNRLKPINKKPGRKLTQARREANARYNSKFVEVKVRMTPKHRTEVQEHAASMDESATQFINRAINETIERDCQNKETK